MSYEPLDLLVTMSYELMSYELIRAPTLPHLPSFSGLTGESRTLGRDESRPYIALRAFIHPIISTALG